MERVGDGRRGGERQASRGGVKRRTTGGRQRKKKRMGQLGRNVRGK